MSFERDTTDPFVARAIELEAIFHHDAVERDKQAGRPVEQIRLLKESAAYHLPRSQSATADGAPPGCQSYGYLPVVQTIEDHVLATERDMLDSILARSEIKRLFKLRRQLIRFQRVLGPMTEVCGKLVHLDLPCVDVEAKNYFRDVLDHARRVEGTVAGLKDVIT
ncbi:hypothetical protein GGE15_001447 [Rhizobium esperanzae]|uniref:Uncharacterized protein n=1 Tax=Rhizobium esperanzae TaxID=1967781 RepID=A0A7W6UH96_9HYPH|nr:hypothetical protein [Rhizobium esperanzae]